MIALILVALAGLVLMVALARNHGAREAAVLGALLVACAAVGRLLMRDLRTHPANFPDPAASSEGGA